VELVNAIEALRGRVRILAQANLLKELGLREGRHLVHEPSNSEGFLLRRHAAMPFAESQLTEAEEAELDQMEHINHLMTLLKAEARKILAAQRKS
jgi:hypothetical protein